MKRSLRSLYLLGILIAGFCSHSALLSINPIEHPRRALALTQAFLVGWGLRTLLSNISMQAFNAWTQNSKDIPIDTKNALDKILADAKSKEEIRLWFKTAERGIMQLFKVYPQLLLPILTTSPLTDSSISREQLLSMISTAISAGAMAPLFMLLIFQTYEKLKEIGTFTITEAYKKLHSIATYVFSDLFTIDHTYYPLNDYPLIPHSTMPYCGPKDPVCLSKQKPPEQPQLNEFPIKEAMPLASALSELFYTTMGYLFSEYTYPIAQELLNKYHILFGAAAPTSAAWQKAIEKTMERYVSERLSNELRNAFLAWVVTFSKETEDNQAKPLSAWKNETKEIEEQLEQWKKRVGEIKYGYRMNIASKIYTKYKDFYDVLVN